MARQAIEQDWEDPWAHLSAGYVHMVSRRSIPAVQEFSEALERNPNFAFAHMLLGPMGMRAIAKRVEACFACPEDQPARL